MKRITKIICTLGPACNKKEIIDTMVKAGMDVARLNMSHGTIETHQALVEEMQEARVKGLKLLVDTKGPEIRIGTFKRGAVEIETGQTFTFTAEDCTGTNKIVSLKYKTLIKQVEVGQKIFANNGMLVFEVVKVTKSDIVCKVLFGGKLSNNKGLNVPGVIMDTPYLSEADKQDILFAIKNKADYLALSFVSNKQNVLDVKQFLKDNGGEDIKIIAKIENASGVRYAESILGVCDGLMVARGDLGIEIPLEKIPAVQKHLISLCNIKRKFCIVATEMLESMTNSTRPTRAEVNDVADAIYEEANATMLSGETSVGINPVLVVSTMNSIIVETEKHIYGKKAYS